MDHCWLRKIYHVDEMKAFDDGKQAQHIQNISYRIYRKVYIILYLNAVEGTCPTSWCGESPYVRYFDISQLVQFFRIRKTTQPSDKLIWLPTKAPSYSMAESIWYFAPGPDDNKDMRAWLEWNHTAVLQCGQPWPTKSQQFHPTVFFKSMGMKTHTQKHTLFKLKAYTFQPLTDSNP